MRISIYTYPICFGHTAPMTEPGKALKENQDSFVHGLLNIVHGFFRSLAPRWGVGGWGILVTTIDAHIVCYEI